MEDRIEDAVESKVEWVAPELKKIDLEEVTAAGTEGNSDGTSFSS